MKQSRECFAGLLFVVFLSGCSTLRTPEYVGPSRRHVIINHSQGRSPNALPSGSFELIWPVHSQKLTQRFAPSKNRSHDGIDVSGRRGTPIYAAHTGRVIFAGTRYSGYGKMIIIEYNEAWATLYAHMNKLNVKTGAYVQQGSQIGTMGRTGRASGVHLHFELLSKKIPVDPLEWLPRR